MAAQSSTWHGFIAHQEEVTMTRNLVLTIIGCVLLSFVLATICHLAFPDILPYAAGEDDASSWQGQTAFLITASAWLSAEVAGLFAIVLVTRLWNRSTARGLVARKTSN
jgi:CBS domain containing-hemolysin-like protein